ncbi:MAG: TonB-dependent receptor [Desulfobulbaceae bacterium]|nr:TonB-dependent receptor [Desulfobulbaceae bacterium]
MKQPSKIFYFFMMGLFLAVTVVSAASANSDGMEVLSLDELLDLDVVTVAKVPKKITQSPAAIYVIPRETLRRSGVDSIPEALRMVPGMHVYRINATKWAISSRGFSGRFANKMLVMIDGRTVYTPLFSGVYWDVQDTMLEDVERIEVIRGPGGTLWGTNAVNGIINIITRESADTQGALLSIEAGSHDNGTVAARYGGWLDEKTSYRIYGKIFDRDSFESLSEAGASDEFSMGRTGFRMDRNQSSSDVFTLQGDLYFGKASQSRNKLSLTAPYSYTFADEAELDGGNLLGRWSHTISTSSDMNLQLYYDRTKRDGTVFSETRDTLDIDFQHRFGMTENQEVLWGLGYRYSNDKTVSTIDLTSGLYSYHLTPATEAETLLSSFIQDRFSFADGRGEITLGTKVEHNDYSGLEWQPSGRLLWNFSERSSFWTAISRSVRTPSRSETGAEFNSAAFFNPGIPPAGMVTVTRILANDELDSEKVMSYELGYRIRPTDTLFIDLTTYYNYYKDLVGGIAGGAPHVETAVTGPYMVMPVTIDNCSDGETYGFELSSHWSVVDWWRLNASYTWFEFNVLNADSLLFQRPGFDQDEQAQHQVSLSSYMDLSYNLELNAMLSYVGALSGMNVESYVNCDLNLAWHPTAAFTVIIGGRNLFDSSHVEFNSIKDGIIGSEIPRNFYGQLSWNF